MLDFRRIVKESGIRYNIREFERYLRFIERCHVNEEHGVVIERHHILPKSMFIEYEKDDYNIKLLTGRQHFIAHWMLAKSFAGPMWFAFNQMRRIGNRSILYEYARSYISEVISKANTGKKHSEEFCQNISERFTGTVLVKDKEGNIERVSTDDIRYVLGELVYHKTGSKHRPETIEKMKQNGIGGLTCFVDENDQEHFYTLEEGLLLGLSKGRSKKSKEKQKDTVKGRIWVHVLATGKDTRIDPSLFDSSLYVRGRKNGNGFKYINENGLNKGDKNVMKDPKNVEKQKAAMKINREKKKNEELKKFGLLNFIE